MIVNYRTADLVKHCLEALHQEQKLHRFEVLLVDGGSGDGSAKALDRLCRDDQFASWTRFLSLELNGGFGWANNQAILTLLQDVAPPDFIHLLNPDTIVAPSAVAELATFLSLHEKVGAVGSQLINVDGSAAGSAFRFPTVGSEFARGAQTGAMNRLFGVSDLTLPGNSTPIEVDWVTGASVMFRSSALKDAGLFDEGIFLYHEEVELMWRVKQCGWSVWHQPASRVVHLEGASTGIADASESTGAGRGRPAYWYQSRRRMFVLLYGYRTAFLAAVAWLLGHLFWRARAVLGLARGRKPVNRELKDHLQIGFRFSAQDRQLAAPAWNSKPSSAPMWIRRE